MKRLIYFTYLGLLLFILFSCQKENIAPVTTADANPAARIISCNNYSFITKANNTVNLGNARADVILVVFKNLPMHARQQILSKYPAYLTTEGEYPMDSGVITIVKLKAGLACLDAENMIADLQNHGAVGFAGPTFNPLPNQSHLLWQGSTNEILVTLNGNATPAQLKQLVKQTRTEIITSFQISTGTMYVVSTDKHSSGDGLAMSTLFNSKSFVAEAEPNFMRQLPPFNPNPMRQQAGTYQHTSAVFSGLQENH